MCIYDNIRNIKLDFIFLYIKKFIYIIYKLSNIYL